MYAIGTSMWIVIPLTVFALGAFIRVHSDSLAIAVITMYSTLILATALVIKLLCELNNEYKRRASGRHTPAQMRTPLEPVVILIALVALIAVTIWFHTSDACGIGAGAYVCG